MSTYSVRCTHEPSRAIMSTTSKFVTIYLLLVTTVCEQTDDNTISYGSYEQNHREGKMMINDLLKTVLGGNFDDIFGALRDTYTLPDGLEEPLREYDFIIVGAGSAGSAIAAKLTENPNVTVLLLEAGKSEMLLTDAPIAAPIFQSTDYAWPYYMEPQEGVCLGMDNQRCYWPRGKAVGGTSVINYMIYTRGRKQDWDRMEAAGNYGWSYTDIIKYYIGMERADLEGYERQPHRGRDGEIPITFVPYQTKLLSAFLEAGEMLGIPTVDYNAPERLGFGTVQCTMQNGHRFSAAKVYLHPNKNRKNLHILEQTRVLQILIDPNTKTAYGVKYRHRRQARTAIARKEVILSAGPIASPQLLMLSGVGPADHLNSLNIPVIQDLQVGRTLYDHICFPGLIFTLNETNLSIVENRAINVKSFSDWFIYGDSVLGTTGVEGIGYIKTSVSEDPDPGVPDIELIALGGSLASDGGPGSSKAIRRGMRLKDRVTNEAFGRIDGTDTWSAFPMLLYPKSFGYLELKDKNPFSNPRMYGNYLTDRKDVDTFIASIRYIQKLVATPPFQRFGAKVHPAKYKFCSSTRFDSDEYWECALRTLTATLHHQVGTCRMGPDGDRRAVVDPELRVRGIRNLRVADSSVIPYPLAAHTHAPATVVGLKAADLIKSTWQI